MTGHYAQNNAEKLFQEWLKGYAADLAFPRQPFLEKAAEKNCLAELESIFTKMSDSPTAALSATGTQLQEGLCISNYALINKMDGGSTGTVWRAFDNTLQREVAIKISLHTTFGSSSAKKQFLREARAAAAIKHPSIVDVIGVGDDDGQVFIVFELIPDAKTLAANGKSFEENAINFAGICQALDLAHAKTIAANDKEGDIKLSLVHGDIKPSNIMVDQSGVFKLADFGAASFNNDLRNDVSLIGGGTRAYWSPRIFKYKQATHHCDQWAMGVTIWEFFTGQHPFLDGEVSRAELCRRVQDDAPLGDSSNLPIDLKAIILKMLEKSAAHRYSNLAAVADDLLKFSKGYPVNARRPTIAQRSSKWVRRNKVFLSLFVLSITSTIVLGIAVKQTIAIADNARESTSYIIGLLGDTAGESGLEKRRRIFDTIQIIENHIDTTANNDPATTAKLFMSIGHEYIKLHNYSNAISSLLNSLKQNSLSFENRDSVLLMLARAYINNGRPQLAIDLLEQPISERINSDSGLHFLLLYNQYAFAHMQAARLQFDRQLPFSNTNPDLSLAEDLFKDVFRKHRALGQTQSRHFFKNELDLLSSQLSSYYPSTKFLQRCKAWVVNANRLFGNDWKHIPEMHALISRIHTLNGNLQYAALSSQFAEELATTYRGIYDPKTVQRKIELIDSLIAVDRINEAQYLYDKLEKNINDFNGRMCFADSPTIAQDLTRFASINGNSINFHNPPGFTSTATIPGHSYQIHSPSRPQPIRALAADDHFSPPPDDAIVLFNGNGLSQFSGDHWNTEEDSVMTCAGGGDISTIQSFGDCQLHIEFRTPLQSSGDGQGMGNSGVFLMNNYEVQVLDSYDNISYADGSCGALYGQFPPLLNVSKPPGEWQSYDIHFKRPRFDSSGNYLSPPRITVLHNGVPIHVEQELLGPSAWQKLPQATFHRDRLPIRLQDHGNPVSYRNIWIRDLEQ